MTTTADALERLRGAAKRSGRSVSGLAKWVTTSKCPTSCAAYAASVDLDRLLTGTRWEPEFGQSPDAIARGARVEQLARMDSYKTTFELVQQQFGFSVSEVRALDMRSGYARTSAGQAQRAADTEAALKKALQERPDAPNVIDGAVLATTLGGVTAHLEADSIGAKAGPQLYEIEIKGWAVVDGQANDAGGLGGAIRQMGVYRYLQMDLVHRLGFDPAVVAETGLLVTPKNVGLQLIGTPIDLVRPTRVAEVTLAALPGALQPASELPPDVSFGGAAPSSDGENARGDVLHHLMDEVGTRYADSCLTSCGLAKFCRDRAERSGSASLCGSTAVRLLPGVRNLGRAAELADGKKASADEEKTGAAEMLALAGRLIKAKSRPIAS